MFHRNHKAYQGRGEGGGTGVWRWGEREIIYLSLHCHHQNDFCIKMDSDESHFNVSVGSDGQSHKTVSTNHNLFWRERRAEAVSNRGPSACQPNALPLGQTGSLVLNSYFLSVLSVGWTGRKKQSYFLTLSGIRCLPVYEISPYCSRLSL